jgi:hypothetical protein
MTPTSKPHSIRLSLTDEQARALLVAIKNMEGDDNETLLAALDRVDEKIRSARRKA